MLRTFTTAILFTLVVSVNTSAEDQPMTLSAYMGEWQYPGSELRKPTPGDGRAADQIGNSTVSLVTRKTVRTTVDSIDKVLAYYKAKLTEKPAPKPDTKKGSTTPAAGRYVTFHSDVADRPVAVHIISINQGDVSTTLVITRTKTESKTHIALSQSVKVTLLDIAG